MGKKVLFWGQANTTYTYNITSNFDVFYGILRENFANDIRTETEFLNFGTRDVREHTASDKHRNETYALFIYNNANETAYVDWSVRIESMIYNTTLKSLKECKSSPSAGDLSVSCEITNLEERDFVVISMDGTAETEAAVQIVSYHSKGKAALTLIGVFVGFIGAIVGCAFIMFLPDIRTCHYAEATGDDGLPLPRFQRVFLPTPVPDESGTPSLPNVHSPQPVHSPSPMRTPSIGLEDPARFETPEIIGAPNGELVEAGVGVFIPVSRRVQAEKHHRKHHKGDHSAGRMHKDDNARQETSVTPTIEPTPRVLSTADVDADDVDGDIDDGADRRDSIDLHRPTPVKSSHT